MLDEDWLPIQDPACAILIHDIMRNVKRLSKATVCVDAREQDHLDLSLDRYCLTFLNDILDACVTTGCKIEEASLSDLISPSTDDDPPGDEIYAALAAFDSLRIFRYQQRDALEDVLEMPEEDEIALLKTMLESIMHQSTSLEELHWAAPYDLWSVGYVPCPTPSLFNIDRLQCLRLLSLANLCCSYSALRASLLACRRTLTTVRFEMLRIEASDEAWTRILEVLRGMLVLRDISLTHLSQGEGDRTEFLQFLVPGDGAFERHHFVPGREYVDAASFLEWNLEHGLKYQ
ncbi:hypothetical protein M409DRAFT_26814 [Zasmidium cellare ATCC 36951]|uniref:Uncharacterized protein n=1 Tax=Zasmidium cellare ATCC 36951 TaxID=1080233 RepID=A0A6A6CAN2_ZASCE|nr:uncharacterized protein M409DRAFT_26814 [Zasmidium cellare ATCC 36951]KAF2162962.1 hypothetical protein M409DRAFT_26814 [Zasmidium cellare ATCC 36951]